MENYPAEEWVCFTVVPNASTSSLAHDARLFMKGDMEFVVFLVLPVKITLTSYEK